MTNKLKQAIAVQRQIPEHIRTNYPVFVEFVKMYYDFLQQSQSQQLESIRDIDSTLDEFIDKFKDELSKSFPLEMATDKRFILKHLREFYLSRGSESSYNFLFRVLFGKEADLFYPSTQMLRVSDGKWKQDVSIFLTSDDPTYDLNNIDGQYIYITSAEGKKIRTFVENVTLYNDTIYEVFIQRSKSDDVSIGATVSYTDAERVVHTATILPCPTKVKIYKGGSGFKVGQLYALKTQLGRGCVIKITKVDTGGVIKNIQIVRFGLDYKTKFWSYLSNSELGAYEYVHPAQLNHPYNANEPHYNERSGGFTDFGWASKQEYFYYDRNIPVGNESFASHRFFADPDYVGNIQQQFYADDQKNPIDDSVAILEVELGAVAHYPGYYMKADGFISDEIYIQDGKYYQAFSYVVRVEEELRKYADIVKALVHPSGTKLYAEYSIFNSISLTATTPKLFDVLYLPLDDHSPSQATIDDRGYSYNAYTTSVDDSGIATTTPADGASKIYAKQGKASLLYEKITRDFVQGIADNVNYKEVIKDIAETIENTEVISKSVAKSMSEVLSEYLETQVKAVTKSVEEQIILQEVSTKLFQTIKQDIQLLGESSSRTLEKITTDTISSIVDANVNELIKNFVESLSQVDTYTPTFYKNPSDISIVADILSNNITKSTSDDISSIIDIIEIMRYKLFEDTISDVVDSYINEAVKNASDSQSLADTITNETLKVLSDNAILAEALSNFLEKQFADSNSISDLLSNTLDKKFTDSHGSFLEEFYIGKTFLLTDVYSNIIDSYVRDTVKSILDSVATTDELSTVSDYVRSYSDTNDVADQLVNAIDKSIQDVIASTVDTLSNSAEKSLADVLTDYLDLAYFMLTDETGTRNLLTFDYSNQTDSSSYSNEKLLTDTINNSTDGRIVLSPYGSELYFDAIDDYQTSTHI